MPPKVHLYEPKIFGFNIHGKRGSKFFNEQQGTIKYIEDSLQQMEKEKLIELQDNLLLCFTGFARSAPEIAKHQIRETPSRHRELNDMQELTKEAYDLLRHAESNLDDFGELLNIQWKIKRSLTNEISNPELDEIYSIGIRNGAIGGKLLGAGGGGFMLFYVRKELHQKIRNALPDKLFVPFNFEYTGSNIIYFAHE